MSSYHTTQHLLKSLDSFTCDSIFQVKTIATTVDNWPIKQVLLNTNTDEAAKLTDDKLRVLISFGIHGREYFASELGFRFMDTLCNSKSARVKSLLKNTAFAMIPIMNPSGRSRTDAAEGRGGDLRSQECYDRRKNGNLVDMNRNFDHHWHPGESMGLFGQGPDPNADDYSGPDAASEVEVVALQDLARRWKPHMYIDVHTGTRAMYTPWNWKKDTPPSNQTEGNAMLDLLAAVQEATGDDGESIWRDPVSEKTEKPLAGVGGVISYEAAGTASDYMYGVGGAQYSFIFETFEEDGSWRNSEQANGADLSMRGGRPKRLPRGGGQSLDWRSAQRPSSARLKRYYSLLQKSASDNLVPATSGLRKASLGDNATQAQPQTSSPSSWATDSCFSYFNPITTSSLDRWLDAWEQALLVANERLVTDRELHLI